MKKYNKLVALILALTMLLSTAIVGFAEEGDPVERKVETGFYIKAKDENGESSFVDIYTYLNGDFDQLLTDAGFENVLFVHQSGKGATLDKILQKGTEEALDFLDETDFADEYKDEGTGETIKPIIVYVLDAKLDAGGQYKADEVITVSGRVLYKGKGVPNVDITLKLESKVEGVDEGETENSFITELIWVEQLTTGEGSNEPDATTDEAGEFICDFQLPEGTEPGKYTLTVKANEPVNKSTTLDFEVVGEEPVDEIPAEIISEMVVKMADLYKHIDENDKPAIRDARANLKDLNDEVWAGLLTDEVAAKFESKEAAKEAIKSAILDLAELYYSADSEELEGRLTILAEKHLPTYRTIFGYEETVEELFSFFKALVENIPNGIDATTKYKLVNATDEELLNLIDKIAKNTLSNTLKQEEYAKFNGKLSKVELSVDTLLGVRENITNKIDSEGKAQIAMIMAYTRMNTVVEGPKDAKVGETAEYKLTVLDMDASTYANWSSSNEDVATIEVVDNKVVLTPVGEGTATITVYRGDNEANWIARFDVVVKGEEVEENPITAEVEVEEKIIINGKVALEEGQEIANVSVSVYQGENFSVIIEDLTEIGEFLDGTFSFELEIPEDLESGEYTVEIQVLLEGSAQPLVFKTIIIK